MAQANLQALSKATSDMWGGQKDVQDLVRGIRAHKKEESNYIRECLQEIKEELKEENHQKKALAVQKLTYLQMLGYDISWAAFNIVEVMSQPTFTNKRIGYLAASQSFHEGTEVVMLTTSLFKKALTVPNQYEAGIALNCLANICTPDLARDLAADIVAILNSSRAYLRKKGILVLYKIFLKFPEALRPSFPRLKDRLEDTDQSVISAAVNVICELARKNPKNYLPLAPTLFKILQSSTNNWMLIKIIKLFGALTPLEKRLAKRLVQPLTNLINTTTAMSLLYECIQTCIIGLSHKIPLMRLCITKLRTFIEDPDQNLKYLGLLALNSIMKVHPKAVGEHRDLIIKCLEDPDITIRLRALDLLTGMVTKKNLRDIIKKLIEHVHTADGHYKDNLIEKIISICNQDSYHFVTDFEWYITVLMTLVRLIGPGTKHGKLISSQFMDVIIRVNVVRSYGVKNMIQLLRDSTLFNEGQGSSVQEVLYAAAWIVGEFSSYSRNFVELMEVLLQPRVVSLPAEIQAIYMQNILKIFAQALKATYQPVTLPDDDEDDDDGDRTFSLDPESLEQLVNTMLARLPIFKQSIHLEVQERACFAYEMVSLYNELRKASEDGGASVAQEVYSMFEQPLNPVAPKAQKKVRPPEGLDLDAQINEVPESESEESESESESESSSDREETWFPKHEKGREAEVKKAYRPQSAYILTGENARRSSRDEFIEEHAEPPPVASVADLGIHDPFSRKVKKRSHRHSKPVINKGYEMPEDMDDSNSDKEEDKKKKKGGIYADVDLSRPLEAHENLPVQQHRIVMSTPKKEETPSSGKKDKDGKHRSSRHRDRDGKHRDRDGKDRKSRHRHGDKEHRDQKASRSRSSSTTSASSQSKGEKPAHIRSYEAGPRLIDISPSSPKAPSSPALSATAPASPGLSFLEHAPSPAPIYEQIGSPSLGTSAAPTMSSSYSSLPELSSSPLVSGSISRDKHRSSRDSKSGGRRSKKDKDDRKRKDEPKSSSSRHGDKKSKKEKDIFADYKKDKKDKKEKEKRRHRSKGDDKDSKSSKQASLLPISSEEESKHKRSSRHDDRRHKGDRHGHRSERGAPAPAPAAPQALAPVVSTLVSDGSLRVVYTFRINPSEPNKVMAALNVINTATTDTITGISFTTIDTMSTKLVSGLSLTADLGPGQSVPHQLIFSLSNFVLPQKVKGSLSYTQKGATESTPKSTPFELTFPPSTFIQPIKLSSEFLMGILDPSGTVGPSLQTASTNVALSEGHDLVQSLISMQATLHVEVVERTPTAVSFYGRSLQDLHVIVLAKIKSPSAFSVEIKSNNGTLASSLIAEVNALFR